ncbi:MAG: 1-acyl-sn-glycerol-3-phosphate acyltransferase [Candidatus Goldbacteria bacterium]|nr:1-acyl-sn-glycerol-3-phosphate acyltransferase [Candidatus Goldiibacteriota bacterium]
MRKFVDKIMSFIIVWLGRFICIIFFKLFYFLKVKNKKNIPKDGGLIIVANHSSFYDPPLIGCTILNRNLKFMARDTLFKPIWGQFLKWMGAFPIRRGVVDRTAYNTLIDYVKHGETVVFFPEGTRNTDGIIKEGKPGTGMLIYNSKAKVLPVYIHNSWKAWPRGKLPRLFVPVTVDFGNVMDFTEYFSKESSKELYIEITDKVIERLKEMQKKYYINEVNER